MDKINTINDFINEIVWGVPMIALILGVGIYYTIRLGFPQLKSRKYIKEQLEKKKKIPKQKD